MVDAEPHTPCCSSFETYGGSSNVFENPRLNHAVDPCAADIQRHLNEPGQPDWPTLRELERRCRLEGGGPFATGIVTNGWDTTSGLPVPGPLCERDLRLRSEMAIEDWPLESRPACSRKGWEKELLQQNLDLVALGRQPCAQRIQHRWWNTQFLLEA